MAVDLPIVFFEKKTRKRSVKPRLHASGAIESSPAKDVLGLAASFDPRLLLTKLADGKTSQEYKAEESIFSQGEPADAVFFLQTGKVKLTVVSKRGKEAVVAILPQ